MLGLIALVALIVPTFLAVDVGRHFIRQGKATVGLLSGLSLIVVLLIATIALDVVDCVAQCPPRSPGACGSCGAWSGYAIIALIAIALVDMAIFLFAGLFLARRHKAPFLWPNVLLIAMGLIAIVISVVNYFQMKPYFEALPVAANAVRYYSSFVGAALGLFLIVFATVRARRHDSGNVVDSS